MYMCFWLRQLLNMITSNHASKCQNSKITPLYEHLVMDGFHLSQVFRSSQRIQRHYVIHPLHSLDPLDLIHNGQCVSSAVIVPADEVHYGQAANIRPTGV